MLIDCVGSGFDTKVALWKKCVGGGGSMRHLLRLHGLIFRQTSSGDGYHNEAYCGEPEGTRTPWY